LRLFIVCSLQVNCCLNACLNTLLMYLGGFVADRTRIVEYAQSDWLYKSCQKVNCGELEGSAMVLAVIC
jgi:hypothetical protein